MAKSKRKYTKRIEIAVTPQMHQFLKLLAERQRASVSDIVRQAIREHLDYQDEIIGSRSRLGRRVTRQLEMMQNRFLGQLRHTSTVLLAALILEQMKQGATGSDVLDQIAKLADHAEDQIGKVLET